LDSCLTIGGLEAEVVSEARVEGAPIIEVAAIEAVTSAGSRATTTTKAILRRSKS
jgi:hypothetical protein